MYVKTAVKIFSCLALILALTMSGCQSLKIATPCNSDRSPSSLNKCSLFFSGTQIQNSVHQHSQFQEWATAKTLEIKALKEPLTESQKFNVPELLIQNRKTVVSLTAPETERSNNTVEKFFKIFGRDTLGSFIWTGVEPGNPLTRHEEYRWNSLREAGMYSHASRIKFIAELKNLGIQNIRLGLSNHEINLKDDSSWDPMIEMVNDFYKNGIAISLDLHHFGIEDRFRVVDTAEQTVGAESYYLHKDWPDYFADFSVMAVKKLGHAIKGITLVNEPETVAGFNGEMWHGGFPRWEHPETNRYYIERCIQVGLAAVKARTKIENYIQNLPDKNRPDFIYVHTEAAVHKHSWEEFNQYRRFTVSDMILGHEGILAGDVESIANMPMEKLVLRWDNLKPENRTVFDWIVRTYVVERQNPEDREEFRGKLVQRLRALQSSHSALKKQTGKTMRTDTVLAVDYYAHNEDKDSSGQVLNPEPQFYAEQVKQGRRAGFYPVIVDYFNHYKIPMMGGEAGTVFHHYGNKWNQQMLVESAVAAEQGIPFLAYTLYPGIDTWGWESALSVPKSQAVYNPAGVFDLEFKPKAFMNPFLESLRQFMK